MAPLTGKDNFREWSQTFQIACQYRGIWKLFAEKESDWEPNEDFYEENIRSAKSDDEVARLLRGLAFDRKEYRDHQQKMQCAMAFLLESVDTKIREEIDEFDELQDAWVFLMEEYHVPANPTSLKQAQDKMESLHQRDCTCLKQYLQNIKQCRLVITQYRGQYSENACKIKIISGLKPDYASHLIEKNILLFDIHRYSLDQFEELLLKYEAEMEG